MLIVLMILLLVLEKPVLVKLLLDLLLLQLMVLQLLLLLRGLAKHNGLVRNAPHVGMPVHLGVCLLRGILLLLRPIAGDVHGISHYMRCHTSRYGELEETGDDELNRVDSRSRLPELYVSGAIPI